MQSATTKWQLDPRIRFRRIFDEAVVVHQEKAEALVLNEAGVSFLELCDGHRSFEQIIDLLEEQYDISRDDLYRDMAQFAQDLSADSVIRPIPGTAT